MAKQRTKKTNPELTKLEAALKAASREHQAAIWKEIGRRLGAPSNNYAEVNLSRLNRSTSSDDIAVVPGKVLGAGSIDHPICIAALSFSERARSKILAASGRIMPFEEMIQTSPKGSYVKIIR